MRIFLTLDYEVFFGRRTGSVARTLLAPTEALVTIANRHRAALVFFVDAGFIVRLRAEMHKDDGLRRDHDAIVKQLARLARAGHEIQLHVHPHWEDSRWDAGRWCLDTSRYALHAFDPPAIAEIVSRYASTLREIAGARSAFAYRAGGWVIQPFAKLRAGLRNAGITIDSTVYAGGRSEGATQPFDFRGAPPASRWRFDDDPMVEIRDGPFLEMPIASRRVGPAFFWKLAWLKKLGRARHRAYGDGEPLALEGSDLVRKLTRPTASVVSIDGYKASFLADAAADYRRRGLEDFVVIGHPKALTPYSLARLDEFLAARPSRDAVCAFEACA
jgi:hypothetical protein